MRAYVVVKAPDGTSRSLGPGDIVGRVWTASLHLDDPRISEAHAMVSLRGDQLRLLALRGRFAVDGQIQSEVDLAVGQRITLARPDLTLEVVDVVLPDLVAALDVGEAPWILHGAAALVPRTPGLGLVNATTTDAAAWIWPSGGGWRLRLADGHERALEPGERFDVAGITVRFVYLPRTPVAPTRDGLAARVPLRVVVRYETVHLHRAGAVPVVLDGLAARLVSELTAFGVPVAWTMLSDQLWPGDPHHVTRKRFDGVLARLRGVLQAGGVRADLVRGNGLGQFEIFLEPGDTVEDQQ